MFENSCCKKNITFYKIIAYMNKITPKFFHFYILLFSLTFISTLEIKAQNISTTERPAGRCQTCAPTGWNVGTGTPDVSDRNIVAATGTYGGGEGWIGAPLPLPPNGHTTWITVRDVGSLATEERVSTTMTNLVVGRQYEVIIYSLSARTATYSPQFIDAYEYLIQGNAEVMVGPVTQNTWGTRRARFTATATSMNFEFSPGNNMGDNLNNLESVNLSISLNAINSVPVATNNSAQTRQGVPIVFNVTSNDTDANDAINPATVDLDVNTAGIQQTFTNAQGTWTVDNQGNVRFTSVNSFTGNATLNYTVNDTYTQDGQSRAATSNPAVLTVNVVATPDSDGDGVNDEFDLDDDNDGILDCEEKGLQNADFNDVFVVNGSAAQSTTNSREVVLTQAVGNQSGQTYGRNRIDFTKGFTFNFQANLGTKDNNGADGIAIIFHNSPAGTTALGGQGIGMGSQGIANGIVLELDTFDNGATVGDIPNDHTMIWDSDNQGGAGLLSSAVDFGNLEDGAWHDVVVSWYAVSQTLTYTVDGRLAGSFTGDLINNYFGGASQVYFGYTASTGGFNNQQRIRFADFCSVPFEVDTDSDGTPNYLDTDSDNDGCPDALEGSNTTLTRSNLNANNRLNGGVDSNGVPTIVSGGQTNVSSRNAAVSGPNCDDDGDGVLNQNDACPNFNNSIDLDGDGVPDGCDLDDDNDGILDSVEEAVCVGNLSYEFYNSVPAGASVDNIPTTGAVAKGRVTNFDVDALWASATPGDGDTFSIRYRGTINIATAGTYTFYTNSDDGSKLLINGTVIVSNDGNHALQERSGTVYLNSGIQSIQVLFFENGGAEELSVSYAGPSIAKTALPFSILSCGADSDLDGILDYRDLDSDNDGCPDALEGSNTSITRASLKADTSINGAVSNRGVPTAAGSGQNDSSSKNPYVTGTNCDDDGDGVINGNDRCPGSNDTLDFDGDGVPDGCDRDDDNDGILDTNEQNCATLNNGNSTVSSGDFAQNIFWLSWTGSALADGIDENDTATINLPGGGSITATFTNVRDLNTVNPGTFGTDNGNGPSDYFLSDFNTFTGALLRTDYNVAGASIFANANGTGNNNDISFDVTFTARTASGTVYTPDLIFADSEQTNNLQYPSSEYQRVTTNGRNWEVIESVGGTGYNLAGNGSRRVQYNNTGAGVPILRTVDATRLSVEINTAGQNGAQGGQGFAFGVFLECLPRDTDGDAASDSRDTDSDNDGCSDANEAYNNPNADGGDNRFYGTGNPPAVNADGTVVGATYPGTNSNVTTVNVAPTISVQLLIKL